MKNFIKRIIVFFYTQKIRLSNWMDERKKKRNQFKQYTKRLVTALTVMACIWISTSYVYAGACLFLYGNAEYLSELSQQVCITILGVVISYAVKSYAETFSERKQILEEKKFENEIIKKESDKDSVG